MASIRLISFLGTGDYQSVRYFWPGQGAEKEVETRYAPVAFATTLSATEIVILATEKAEAKHAAGLREALAAAQSEKPDVVRIHDGKTPDELWDNFRILKDVLGREGAGEIVVDITHGFRSQPFFAGAVVSFLRNVNDNAPDTRIVYGAFDARDEKNRAPLWDLTAFSDLVDWTQAIRQFLASGDAERLADRAEVVGRRLARDWAVGGKQGERPDLTKFAQALRDYGRDLVTVRTAALLLPQGKLPSAADGLHQMLQKVRDIMAKQIPPLAEILDHVEREMAMPLSLSIDHLAGAEGARAMTELARLYMRLGRYAEAAVTLREGWVCLYAAETAARPGDDFDEAARAQAERHWREAIGRSAGSLAQLRNDLLHGGFNKQPLAPDTIRDQLEKWIENLSLAQPLPAGKTAGKTYFVTRHAGALEWAAGEGFAVDEVVNHLDVRRIEPGDTVIGSLPVNLAADVCARGGRYFHLTLDLPPEARGMELSAEDMRRYGARVEAFEIRSGSF